MEERQLIELSLNGHDEAFNQLLEPYVKAARQTAYLLLHDYSLAEDTVQEALLQAYYSLKRFNPEVASMKTWFTSIVIHMAHKLRRKQRIPLPFQDTLLKSKHDNPEQEVIGKEKSQVIYEAIQKLSFKLRTVIVLFYFEELSIKQISEVMEIPEATVKTRLFKARNKLKGLLGDLNLEKEGGDQKWTMN